MGEQYVGDPAASDKSKDHAKDNAVQKHCGRRIFYGSFWADHPIAILGVAISLTLASPITDFPEISRSQRYFIYAGAGVLLLILIFWFVDGWRLRNTPTDEELEQEREQQNAEHKQRLESKLAALDSRVKNAEQAIVSRAPRAFSVDQKTAIIASLSKFKGHSAYICCVQEAEARRYAGDLITILSDAGWKVAQLAGLDYDAFILDFDNIEIVLDKAEFVVKNRPKPPAAIELSKVFGELGIARNDGRFAMDNLRKLPALKDTEPDVILIRIGSKPRG